jgi:hypothetical protein
MNTKRIGIAIAALLLLTGSSAAVADEENVWITEDAEEIHIGSVGHVYISEDDAETIDLSELADGETRTFGEGESQISVTRDGDEVTITHPGEEGGRSISCDLSTDSCSIMHIDGDPSKNVIMIKKTGHCEGSDEDCIDIMTQMQTSVGGPHEVMVMTLDCDDEGEDCGKEIRTKVIGAYGGEGSATAQVMVGHLEDAIVVEGDGEGRIMMITAGDMVTLRCPEGDTTMTVDKDEADRVYYCPKHSVELEKAPVKTGARTIQIKKVKSSDED